jgi:hypothetical protein
MLKIWIFRYLILILSSVLFSQQGFAGNCPSELVALFQNQSFETLLDQQGRLPLANKGEVLDADFIKNKGTFSVQSTREMGDFFVKKHSRSGYSLFEVNFGKSDLSQKAYLLYLNYLKKYGLREVDASSAGMIMQLSHRQKNWGVSYAVLDLGRMNELASQGVLLPSVWKNFGDTYRNFVAFQYQKQRGLSREVTDRMKAISSELENRTIVLAKISDPLVIYNQNRGAFYRDSYNSVDEIKAHALAKKGKFIGSEKASYPEKPNLEGGISLVYSQSAEELLPLEKMTSFRIPRRPGEKIAEIGRFTVSRESSLDVSPRLAQQVAAIADGSGIKRLVIEADRVRARLFKQLGFREVEGMTQYNHSGVQEFVLEAEVKDVLRSSLSKEEGLGELAPIRRP